jgi:hypothetical protein
LNVPSTTSLSSRGAQFDERPIAGHLWGAGGVRIWGPFEGETAAPAANHIIKDLKCR